MKNIFSKTRIMKIPINRNHISIIKIVLSLLMISYLLLHVNLEKITSSIERLNVIYLLLAMILILMTMYIHAFRWFFILNKLGCNIKISDAINETYISYFFNQILPTSIGGDVVKIYRLSSNGVDIAISSSSVIADRICGLIACLLISILAIPIICDKISLNLYILFVIIIIFILTNTKIISSLYYKIYQYLYDGNILFANGISNLLYSRLHNLEIILISLLMQVFIATSVAFISISVGLIEASLSIALLFQPVTLMTVLPLSFAGWGIREGALIYFTAMVGVDQDKALLISLIYGFLLMITSLSGGIILIVEQIKKR